ncbi:MAG: hypothetical protein M3T56_10490, partial [Chloroflexota bacterium]|nr:hypothetical protein [Chloroflexota bacterium]
IETDIMVSLGSRAVEELILGTKLAGASSDLMQATNGALTYVARLGMGSTLMVAPASMAGYPPAVLVLVDNMLRQLYDETKRLIQEKEYAVHAVAASLIERQELIGSELDEIFRYADEAHPEKASPFVRIPLVLPKMDDLMKNGANGHVPMLAIPGAPGQPVPGQPPGPPVPGPVPPHPEGST